MFLCMPDLSSYHNRLHAADVVQNIYSMTKQRSLSSYITPLDVFASILAAAIHDFQHPGTTNAFQIASESDWAIRFVCVCACARALRMTGFMCARGSPSPFVLCLVRAAVGQCLIVIMMSVSFVYGSKTLF